MLTRAGLAVLSAGLTLVLGGLAFGNAALMVAGAFPLIALLAAIPRSVRHPDVERDVTPQACVAGDTIAVTLTVTVPAGAHAVEVHQPLPPEFLLVQGTNLHVVAGHPSRARRARFRFDARVTRRGAYTIPPVQWETVNLLGFTAPVSGDACGEAAVDVAPRLGGLTRAHALRLPRENRGAGEHRNPVGLQGTDFADLREYASGDPPKSINWKATARRMTAGATLTPLVNEYEREGRRTVLIVVDANRHLDVGTSLVTGLDHALDGAMGLAKFLLRRGHRVGALLVDARRHEPVHPDTGAAHAGRVARAFAAADPHDGNGLAVTAERLAPFLRGGTPLLVAFTRITPPTGDAEAAVRRIRQAVGKAPGGRLPVILVDVDPAGLVPDPDGALAEARALQDALDAPARDAVKRAGATVVKWDPARGEFASAFLREVTP